MAKILRKLPANKTVVFWSPIEGEDVLVRTGSIDDSSSFFHAILYAYSKEYSGMTKNNKIDYVKKLRASIAGNISVEKWREKLDIITVKKPLVENLLYILRKLYESVPSAETNSNNSNKNKNVRRIVRQVKNPDFLIVIPDLVPMETVRKTLLPSACDNKDCTSMKILRKNILDQITEHVSELPEIVSISREKADYVRDNVIEVFNMVFDEAENVTFKNHVKGLSVMGVKIDSDLIDTVSRRLDRNIYVLDTVTRMPSKNVHVSDNIDKKRKGIIILCFKDGTCETVGRLLTDNKVQREYDSGDPLVELLNTMILAPTKFADKYPDMAKYMMENDTDSDSSKSSENSSESRDYSDSSEYDTSDSD